MGEQQIQTSDSVHPAIIEFLDYNPLPLPDSPPQRLAFYRQVLGLSQRKLAKDTGIDTKTIEQAELGKRPLSKRLLKLLESF